MLAFLTSRLFALMAFVAAAVLVAGCASSPPPVQESHSPSASVEEMAASKNSADDLTATEAAVAALNEAPVAESSQPTAQLIRPDAPMNYTVKRGDTLWDIAAVFLKDPWFWPEIWQINPQVENPHLIYPGDTLSLAYGANGDAHVMISQYGGARLQPRLRSENLDGPIDTIPFSAIAAFLTKPSVLTEDQARAAPHILAFRDQHMIGGTGHEFYVRKLNGEVNQSYVVMHVGSPIYDLESGDLLGYQAYFVGNAIVKATGDVSKAVLTENKRESLQGDRLISVEGERSLTFAPHVPKQPIDGQIVAVADDVTQVGQYQVVVLNRGKDHGLDQGAVLAVDQQGEIVQDKMSSWPWHKDPFGDTVQLPYERSGTLIVFKVYDRMSYGLVIGARAPMRVADRVYNP